MCACKCLCFSPLDQGIKNSFCLFGLQYGARGRQKVNTKLIWALIFLMQTHSAPCVKVLSEVCTKFNKTSVCVICAQHLAKFNTLARVNSDTRTQACISVSIQTMTHAHTHAHIFAHCEKCGVCRLREYYECLRSYRSAQSAAVQRGLGGLIDCKTV